MIEVQDLHANIFQTQLSAASPIHRLPGFIEMALAMLRSFFFHNKVKNNDEEAAPLLKGGTNTSATTGGSLAKPSYGTTVTEEETNVNDNPKPEEAAESVEIEPSIKMETLGWLPYIRRFSVFFPSIWPTNNRKLQLHILGSLVCVFAMRCFKVMAPFQLGILIDALGNGSGRLPMRQLFIYLLLNWMESSNMLGTIKMLLWLPVEQNARKLGSLLAYKHIMNMSCDFHDDLQLGDLYKAIEQGTSLYGLLDTILFTIAPMLIDLLVACAYLTMVFGSQMSIVVFTTTITYLCVSRFFTKKLTEIQRVRLEANRQENRVLYDSIGCWVSVTYFNNFAYELNRYSAAIDEVLKLGRVSNFWSYGSSNATQILMNVGYTGALLIAGYRVSHGTLEVAKFVVLISYWSRFTGEYSDTAF